MQKIKGFTLVELTIVIVIVGILATLGLTNYSGQREKVLDREAQANLRVVVAADQIWKMESNTNTYWANPTAASPAAINQINTELRVALPNGADRGWNYTITTVAPPNQACCVQATRNGAGGRTWRMRNNETEPVVGGACP